MRFALFALAMVAFAQNSPQDVNELLKRGTQLTQTKPAEAVRVLQQAARLEPERGDVRYQLGVALHAIGDEAEAELELREAIRLMPDPAEARKALETVLTAGAISVEVRQVLVPVIVTDQQGHYRSGLTQADFTVLEDGVEQKITSFSVESSGLTETEVPVARRSPDKAASRAVAASSPVRRTYVVCIDTLHSSFNNFVSVREALAKLFAQEHSSDSQYVLIAIGSSSDIVVNTTSDAKAVLAALQNKKFQKIFLEGQTGGMNIEMQRYRRDLNETLAACNMYDRTGELPAKVQCDTGKQRVPREAQEISELDRTLTAGFLQQMGGLVGQLARARDRRTIVLVSDGFQIAPGKEAFDLLMAYFPDLQRFGLRRPERMQSMFEPVLKLAARSNVTIDTIDSRGLYGQSAFDASSPGNPVNADAAAGRVERSSAAESGSTLIEIAKATGGTAFHDSNDLFAGLQRAFADGRNYYLLGYVSSNANRDGHFRAIQVQVRDRHLSVNAKRGYWADTVAQ